MNLNKIVPIFFLIIISGMLLVGIQSASAAHTTEIKAYTFDPMNLPGNKIDSYLNIKKGEPLNVLASLHVDGGKPVWFRNIHFIVANSRGELIVDTTSNTISGGYARFFTNTEKWNSGNYIAILTYLGSTSEEYPLAYKIFILYIK